MKSYSFENLSAWKESRRLTKDIYQLTSRFPEEERFGLSSQLRRAAISVSSNLAEGSGRITHPDQNRFFNLAFSSLMEVLNQVILATDLGYLNEEDLTRCRSQIDTIGRLINGLVKSKQ